MSSAMAAKLVFGAIFAAALIAVAAAADMPQTTPPSAGVPPTAGMAPMPGMPGMPGMSGMPHMDTAPAPSPSGSNAFVAPSMAVGVVIAMASFIFARLQV